MVMAFIRIIIMTKLRPLCYPAGPKQLYEVEGAEWRTLHERLYGAHQGKMSRPPGSKRASNQAM